MPLSHAGHHPELTATFSGNHELLLRRGSLGAWLARERRAVGVRLVTYTHTHPQGASSTGLEHGGDLQTRTSLTVITAALVRPLKTWDPRTLANIFHKEIFGSAFQFP